ncbi:MAG: porin [Candidatus Omnitrophica bacterium]|nr:porin [Candidatus Omnitrophota bacterium]
MRELITKMTVLALLVGFCAVAPVFADSNEVTALQGQVQGLTDKLNDIERQLRAVESKAGAPSSTYVAPAGSSKGGLMHVAEDINMGGYLDVQWNNNFNQPRTQGGTNALLRTVPNGTGTGGARSNTGRIFDRYDGSFAVNASEIYFEKKAENAGEAGFRTDIQFGEDAHVVNGNGSGNTDNLVDLQQAYIEYYTPLKIENVLDQVKVKAGRFVTLAGLEVIEAPDNWNISRSYMFGLAIPFTHTGVRTQAKVMNFFDVYLGLNNGWDLAVDNNAYKTVETGIGYQPINGLTMMHAFYLGNENGGPGARSRWLLSNTASYAVTDKLTVAADVQVANQEKAIAQNISPQINDYDAQWWGVAGYAKYKLTDKLNMAYRAEFFRDESLLRSAAAGGDPIGDSMFEQTLTAEYRLTSNLLARAEFRHDMANRDPIFAGREPYQTTIASQLVYSI